MTEKEEKQIGYELVQVPTEHTIAVQTPEGNVISVNELIVQIANRLEEISKALK